MSDSDPIGTAYGGFPIFKVSRKLYRCRKCRAVFYTDTNHYEAIYICYSRRNCYPTVSDCMELDLAHLCTQLCTGDDDE